jgi:hypothetical protein
MNNAKQSCANKTIFSTYKSFKTVSTASSLRLFFEQNFCTNESKHSFEVPNSNYGVIFFDDIHAEKCYDEDCVLQNNAKMLLLGYLDSSSNCSNIFSTSNNNDSNNNNNSNNASICKIIQQQPVVHKEIFFDPRIKKNSNDFMDDNYSIQKMGFISAATCNGFDKKNNSFLTDKTAQHFFRHFSILTMKNFLIDELHACLVVGSVLSLNAFKIEYFTNTMLTKIVDLSEILISLFETESEQKKSNLLNFINFSFIEKFCIGLKQNVLNIHDDASFLNCYFKELKKYFIDNVTNQIMKKEIIGFYLYFILFLNIIY